MKVNPAAAFHIYQKAADYTRPSHPREGARGAARPGAKADQVQISPEAARRQEVEQLAKSVTAQIMAPASPQRLEALRQAVQENAYHVPAGQLAEALMKNWLLL